MTEPLEGDPRMLRAIAHPVRSTLLMELSARGEATATVLARAIGEPVNVVSFHLRQLSRYGVIEEVPHHGGDGRARWWRLRSDRGLHFHGPRLREQPDGAAAFEVGRRYFEGRWHALVERLFQDHDAQSAELWGQSDVTMLLTDAEARAMQEELFVVMERWVDHGRLAAAAAWEDRNEPRRTYLTLSIVMPHPVDLIER